MNLKAWEQELAAVMPFVLEARRDLHRHPEVGGLPGKSVAGHGDSHPAL